MKIERVELRRLKVPIKAPFETSFGRLYAKESVLVTVFGDGVAGYGESTAFPHPFYNEETNETIWHILRDYAVPAFLGKTVAHPEAISAGLAWIRGNRMALAAFEGAVWDLYARQQGRSLSALLGGTRRVIDVGVSIGIEADVEAVLANVERFLAEGYRKIKIKIKPGFDLEPVHAIRERFGPDVPLMVDANSAYTLADIAHLQKLDAYGLLMIEQPLAHDDLVDHARLQAALATPVCLDESIHTVEDARKALDLGSCRIINIKVGRVGGLFHARAIHDLCLSRNIPVWCGGMMELGIGRAHNIAIASLPGFTIAGDTSASSRSFTEDIVEPAVDFCAPGQLAVPEAPGLGYQLRPERLEKFTELKETFTA